MENIFYKGQIIWSMVDQNGHLRHSTYADFAAQARWNIFEEIELTPKLKLNNIVPILFREELVYLRELKLGESVNVSVEVTKTRPDYSRYTMKHNVYRDSDKMKCAEITVDCAWLNLETRKLSLLSDGLKTIFEQIPKSENIIIEQLG